MTLSFESAVDTDGVFHACVRSRALGGGRADLSAVQVGTKPVAVALFLHGVYGSHWSWNLQGGLAETARQLERSGRIPGLLIVTPSDGLAGDGSAYLDGVPDYESWVADEAPAVAAEVVGAPSGLPLVICGLSMGGYGALRIAGRRRRQVTAASAHSAVTRLVDHRPFGENTPHAAPAQHANLVDVLSSPGEPLPHIRFDCGLNDPLLAANRRLHTELDEAGVAHDYQEFPDGHSWAYWAAHVEDSLRFFGTVLG
jgi:S-formylglutathione hydrolase FrmB